VRIIHVLRKPLAEPSVAANILSHGTGAINIDSCRLGYGGAADLALTQAKNPGRGGEKVTSDVYGANRPQQSFDTSGRWPANLVLEHRPACCLQGTRRVRSNGHYPAARPAGSQVSGPAGHKGQQDLVERHLDGESVSVWDCGPSCPVTALDQQSGPADSGGASRFFKQVGGSKG